MAILQTKEVVRIVECVELDNVREGDKMGVFMFARILERELRSNEGAGRLRAVCVWRHQRTRTRTMGAERTE